MGKMTMRLGALMMAVGLAACGGDEAGEGEGSAASDSAVASTDSPAAPAPASPAPATPAPTGPRLSSRTSPQHGDYLADGNGRALYLLEAPGECYDTCMGVWPPLFVAGNAAATADSMLRQELVGTATRRDGTSIVTYGGHPLYYYAGDRQPGDTQGQHVEDSWGEWYLVRPGGGKVEDGGGRRGRGRDDG